MKLGIIGKKKKASVKKSTTEIYYDEKVCRRCRRKWVFSKYNPSISKILLSIHRYKAVFTCLFVVVVVVVVAQEEENEECIRFCFMLLLQLLIYDVLLLLLFVLQLSPRDDAITEKGPATARVQKRRPTQASKGHNGVWFSILRHPQGFI